MFVSPVHGIIGSRQFIQFRRILAVSLVFLSTLTLDASMGRIVAAWGLSVGVIAGLKAENDALPKLGLEKYKLS